MKKLLLPLLFHTLFSFAQFGSLDPTFNSQDIGFCKGCGVNNTIYSIKQYSNGKILIGGAFSGYNGVACNRIARLNPDGSLDTTFVTDDIINGDVLSLAIQSDGKIVVCGNFTTYNNDVNKRIVRLNANGSLDTTFKAGAGADGDIRSCVLQSDGKILIAGSFMNFNGAFCNRIARLNADGSLDTTFDAVKGAGDIVESLVVQPDDKILVVGHFTSIRVTSQRYIARLNADGSLDMTFNSGTGANFYIYSVALQADGKILIGGIFGSYNGVRRDHIARLNADGSLDTTFNPGTQLNNNIRAIVVQPDGKIMIGGNFTIFNGTTRYIARLNIDGSLDTSFNSGVGTNSYVYSLAIQPDGKILMGGEFTTYNNNTRSFIARLNTEGSIDSIFNPLGTGANSLVSSIALQSDGKILIGGWFTSYNRNTHNRIVRLNSDGSIDSTFLSGLGVNDYVLSIAIQSDSKILVVGNFTSYNGIACNRIVRLNADGILDTTFNIGSGANDVIRTIVLQSDGKILIGGSFTKFNGSECKHIARLNLDGSIDMTFNSGSGTSGSSGIISSLALQPDGKILIGGDFTQYNYIQQTRIARLNTNGSLDTTFNVLNETGLDDLINAIAVLPDGKILIVGRFSDYIGFFYKRIVRLNANGSVDTTFVGTGANDSISTFVLLPEGKILIGGDFTEYKYVQRKRLARLNANGSLDTTFDPSVSVDGQISSLVLQPDGKILMGGWFC
jgi:uncharacterized delta-60 repeat protein